MKLILTENQVKILAESMAEINRLANQANTNPSDAQKQAGNYKMGHLNFSGFDITIENPKGSWRHYKNEDGSDGKIQMKNHYGYFTGTKGYDGDQTDVFLGPYEEFDNVYVVDQNNEKGEFDESKVMLGFKTEKEAKKAYESNFSKDWTGFRCINGVPKDIFKEWLYSGKKQRKPFGEYNLVKSNVVKENSLANKLMMLIEDISSLEGEYDDSENTKIDNKGLDDTNVPANAQMTLAKKLKNDEFYTRTSDIANELSNYADELSGKVIYCNCDDHSKSNFYKYFKDNFEKLGLRGLLTTGINSDGAGVYGTFDGKDEKLGFLEGDGSFSSPESLRFLSKCDVVVSNPPFSLFRDYIDMLMKSGKKFLVLGNMQAIKYKDIFPLFKKGKLWTGYTGFNNGMYFNVPDNFEYSDNYKFKKEIDGQKVSRVSGISWFTNMGTPKKQVKPIVLKNSIKSKAYQKYDNYNAIDTVNAADIPYDYDGYIGVSLTIMNKISPDGFIHCTDPSGKKDIKFKVIGMMNGGQKNDGIRNPESKNGKPILNGKILFTKILIKKIKGL